MPVVRRLAAALSHQYGLADGHRSQSRDVDQRDEVECHARLQGAVLSVVDAYDLSFAPVWREAYPDRVGGPVVQAEAQPGLLDRPAAEMVSRRVR